MSKYFLPVSIILLSFSIIFCGFQVSYYVKNHNNEDIVSDSNGGDKGLLTFEEAAKYLSMSTEQLSSLVNNQEIEREQLRKQFSSFDTYRFIPCIEVNHERYFNKSQLNEWIEYNSIIWTEIND